MIHPFTRNIFNKWQNRYTGIYSQFVVQIITMFFSKRSQYIISHCKYNTSEKQVFGAYCVHHCLLITK